MELFILGIIAALNFMIIKIKFDRKRYEDGFLDTIIFITIMTMTGGSYAGMAVGTIASLFISIFFLASPPTFFSGSTGFLEKFKSRVKRKYPCHLS